jgi:hypothetical protein
MNNFEKYYHKRFNPLEKLIVKQTEKLFVLYKLVLSSTNKTNVYWNRLDKEISKQYKIIDKAYEEWNKIEIPKVYRREMYYMAARINKTKRINATAKLNTTTLLRSNASKQLLASIVSDSIASMSTSLFNGQKLFKRFARLTQQQLVSEALIESAVIQGIEQGNIRKSVTAIYKSLKNKLGDGKFLQVNNRMYKPRYYAELVTRTKFHETQANGAVFTATNYGTDLVRVSSHNTTTEICQAYEGKVFSISGKTPGFSFLDQLPPFHPNCLHLLFPEFIEGYSSKEIKQLSDFSLGKIDKPPFPAGFIPVDQRKSA